MTTHTKGPWKFGDDGSITAQDGAVLAMVYGPDDFPCFDPANHSKDEVAAFERECEANGFVMAAAPELYEACNLALVALANPKAFDEEQVGVKLARAIAKAEGKSNGLSV